MSTDPRIAIVREWFDNITGDGGGLVLDDGSTNIHRALLLIERLDSATPEPSGEELDLPKLMARANALLATDGATVSVEEFAALVTKVCDSAMKSAQGRIGAELRAKEPSGEEVERVAAAMWGTERLRFPGILAWAQLPDDILEHWRTRARAAIAAMRPTWEALGLARELANDINRIITPEDISRVGGVVEKARALVALLERREA